MVTGPTIFAFLLGAAAPVLVLTGVFVFRFVNPYCCSRFDATEWMVAEEGTDWQIVEKEMECIRGRMLTDLRLRHLKAEMQKEELFSLLGQPTQSVDDQAKNCFSYGIGYCRGLGFDSNVVTFCFDASGHLLPGGGNIGG
jgi:hypothetical protein